MGALAAILLGSIEAKADAIAFFYALDADFQTLRAQAQQVGQPIKVGSRTILVLQLDSHRVYAVKMGAGVVETTASAQALLALVQCDRAFSVGPVGALSDNLKVGGWYRVNEVIAYQKGSWTKTGFQLSAGASSSLTNGATTNPSLPELFQKAAGIRVASGEMFIASDNYRIQLRESTGADAVDMNLFGLASVCADHRLPVACWRVVSDRADDNASGDFRQFVSEYKGQGGRAVAEIIKNLPPNTNSPAAYPHLDKLLSR